MGDATHSAPWAAAAAQITGAATELSEALNSSTFPLRAADLAAFDSVVNSSETSTLLAEASAQAGTDVVRARSVVTTSAATRQEVQTDARDIFDKHIFDPYLHFNSAEDEAAFRKREADAKKYVNDQLARGTSEGNLNAGGGMLGEMLDLHAHGAGASPDFMPRWNALVDKTEHQRAAMHAAGQSTEEYDRNLNASVRRFLKTKGLSDAEIDQRLAGAANPLDLVKPYMGNDAASRGLEDKLDLTAQQAPTPPLPQVVASADAAIPAAPPVSDLDAISARLKAHGVRMADSDGTGHGVTVEKPASKSPQGITG
jgi:hypothetical protein